MNGYFHSRALPGTDDLAQLMQPGSVRYTVPANLRRWRAALAKVRAGVGRARILFIGDSKTMGAGAGTDAGSTWTAGAAPRSKPAHLTRLLNAAGVPALHSSWFGSSGLPGIAAWKAYDPRIGGMSASWGGGGDTLGGVMWAAGADSDALTFTPGGAVDTYEIYYVRNQGDGNGRLTLDTDPTAIASFDGNAPAAVGKTVATFARGNHSLNLKRVSGGYLSLIGGIAYDGTAPAVDVVTAGAFGTTSAFHASAHSPWSAANCLATVTPDLVIVQLGSNDLAAGIDAVDYAANIQDIITHAKASGADVVLEVASSGNDGAWGSLASRNAYRDALIGLAEAHGCALADHALRFGSWADAQALGLMRDSIHETEAGYADQAQALIGILLA